MLTLGANILVTVMATLFVLTCLFMILIILIQKPKGGGLSGAFGGAGGSAQAAFGAKTGDLLTTITIGCFVVFLGLAIGLTYAIRADIAPPTATPTPAATTTSNPAGGTTGAPVGQSPSTGTPSDGTEAADAAADQVADAEPQAPKPDDAQP